MRAKFEKQLEDLNGKLIHMGAMVEQSVEMVVSALINRDTEKAEKTIDFVRHIGDVEKEIEHLCFYILLSQQPVAGDLRKVSVATKMITDLKRIGDFAADISEICVYIGDKDYLDKLENISKMAKETTTMVIDCMEAYVQKNSTLAGKVIKADDIVDDLFIAAKKQIANIIHEDAESADMATDLLMVAKYFERMADHAVNIAELTAKA